MSDASEVKRWWVRVKNYDASPVKRDRDRLCCDYEPEPSRLEMFVEVMRVKDHDRIVADLRIKIRSLNLEIETRAKPTVEKLKNEITNLKAEIVRLSRPVSAVCTKCGYDKPANLYEQTIARQAKVIEKLKEKLDEIRWSWANDAGRQCDNLAFEALAAIEKEGTKDE